MVSQYIEKHSLKVQIGTAVSVLIFIIISTYNMTKFATAMESTDERINARVDHLSEKYVTMRGDLSAMQADSNVIKVKLATLEAIMLRVESAINKNHP